MNINGRLARLEDSGRPRTVEKTDGDKPNASRTLLAELELQKQQFQHEPDFGFLIHELQKAIRKFPKWGTVPPYHRLLAMWVRVGNGLPPLAYEDVEGLVQWYFEHESEVSDSRGRLPGCLCGSFRTVQKAREILSEGVGHPDYWDAVGVGLVRLKLVYEAVHHGADHPALKTDGASSDILKTWKWFHER